MEYEDLKKIFKDHITESGENIDEEGLQYLYFKITNPIEVSFNNMVFPENINEIRFYINEEFYTFHIKNSDTLINVGMDNLEYTK